MRVRIGAVVAALAVVGASLVSAGPAGATGGTSAAAESPAPVVFFVRSTDEDATTQLVRHDPDGTEHVLVSLTNTTSGSDHTYYRIDHVVASPVSDRVAYVVHDTQYPLHGPATYRTTVYVSDYDGSARVEAVPPDPSHPEWDLSAWSLDGRALWMSRYDVGGIYAYSTGTGRITQLPHSAGYVMGKPDPADPGAFYGIEFYGNTGEGDPVGTVLYRVTGSGRTAVTPHPRGDYLMGYAVSPDGGSVVVEYASLQASADVGLYTADGTYVRSLLRDTSCSSFVPVAFSPDGGVVYGGWGGGELCQATPTGFVGALPVDRTSEEATPVPGTDGASSPAVVPADTTPPSQPTGLGIVVDGAHPVLSWNNPGDADFSHAVVERYAGTTPAGTPTVLSMPWHARSFVDTVTQGATYTYVARAVDGAGNATDPSSRTMRALSRPALEAPALASTVSAGPGFPVSWAPPENPPTQYWVEWRHQGEKWWQAWRLHTKTTSGIFGAGGGRPTTPWGGTYEFRALTMDGYGNPSPLVYATTVVPFDQVRADFSGTWWRATNAADWRGALAGASHRGAAARFHLPGRVFRVIGDRCPQCGPFRVYVDGQPVGTFGSHKARLAHRQVLATVTAKGAGPHWIRLVDTPGRYGWQLRVDALAASR